MVLFLIGMYLCYEGYIFCGIWCIIASMESKN